MQSRAGATDPHAPRAVPRGAARPVYHRAHDDARAEVSDGAGEEPQHERHLASHVFNLIMMGVGAVALWLMIRSLGWDHFTEAVRGVGWWFAVIVGLDLVALCMDAAALQAFMRPEARMVSYPRVLAAQASGRAINVLTPGGALGEPTKLSLLVSHAPKNRVLSSIVLLNLSQLYLSVLIIVIGTPVMFLLVDIPGELKILVAIGLAFLIPLLVGLGMLVRRGATTTLVAGIRRIRFISDERADAWKLRLAEVDKHIRQLYRNRDDGTWKGLLWVVASKAVAITTTVVLLDRAGVDVTPPLVIGIISVGLLITWVSQIVPMGLGLADGGNYALFGLLGATGVEGMAVTMLTRARSVTVAMLGLLAFAGLHTLNRLQLAKVQRKLDALRERAADPQPPA